MPATTTTTISSVCPTCGTIGKLRKRSCCGRGGSWFKKCGNAKLDHTWYEGIQVCKAPLEESKLALGQTQLSPAQQKRNHDAGMVQSETVITAVKTLEFAPGNMSTRIPHATPIIMSAYTRANAPINSPFYLSSDTSMSVTASSQSSDITSTTHDNGTLNSQPTSAEVATTTSTSTSAPIRTPTITATNILINKSVNTPIRTSRSPKISTHVLPPTVTHSSASMPIIPQGCETLLETVVRTNLLPFLLYFSVKHFPESLRNLRSK